MEFIKGIELPYKILRAYGQICKGICKKTQIPQTAFDILMFLANNPNLNTARDIVQIRGIKANLVSINVDRLVNEGLLERRSAPGDRRKTILVCTEKAAPFIEQGHIIQNQFLEQLFQGIDAAQYQDFLGTLDRIDQNTTNMMKGKI